MVKTIRLLLLVPLVLTSCSKGDKVPSYIDVTSVGLTTEPIQGSATSNITDVWVYADDELLGSWEVPARIPLLREGSTSIRVTPGVKRNGAFDDRLIYPFYTSWTGTVDVVKTMSVPVSPVVTYNSVANFWIEAFEDPGFAFFSLEETDTLLRFTPQNDPDIVLDGSPCGGFVVEPSNSYARFYTDENFLASGGPTFLELDYKSNIRLTVGVLFTLDGIAQAQPYVYVAPSNRTDPAMPWKKIYIDLSPVFNLGISQRDIYFEASLPDGQSEGVVYLDNIKLVR